MPTSFITTNTIVPTGVAVSLVGGTNYHVMPGVVVGSEGGDAMIGTDANISVQVVGSVIGNSAGIRLGDTGDDSNYRIEVASSGYLSGGVTVGTGGVRVFGQSAAVVNQGMISGFYGIVMGATVAGAVSEVFNSGVVTSAYDAILRIIGSTDTLHIVNTGSIIAGANRDALEHNATDAVEQVVNSGSIVGNLDFGLGDDSFRGLGGSVEGDILMGDGADVVDNRRGIVTGTVFGDAGQDIFRGNADEAETFNGGADADTLDFRFGAAVTVALDSSFDNAGAALGDTYQAFERVNGSAEADLIRGNGTGNTLTGGSGDDTLDGAAGADVIRGGTGVDLVTGGLGNDFFRFNSASEFGDVITDFLNVGGNNDRFQIAASIGGGLTTGLLAAAQFVSRADNQAQDANDRFIFRTTDRTLWFDADGNGAGAAVLVADLQAGATMTAADIQII